MQGTLTRILILLLVARVTASPLALRPSSQRPHANYHVVVRICSWPAPRPERAPSTSSLLRNRHGGTPGTIPALRAWSRPGDAPSLPILTAARSPAAASGLEPLRC